MAITWTDSGCVRSRFATDSNTTAPLPSRAGRSSIARTRSFFADCSTLAAIDPSNSSLLPTYPYSAPREIRLTHQRHSSGRRDAPARSKFRRECAPACRYRSSSTLLCGYRASAGILSNIAPACLSHTRSNYPRTLGPTDVPARPASRARRPTTLPHTEPTPGRLRRQTSLRTTTTDSPPIGGGPLSAHSDPPLAPCDPRYGSRATSTT